MTPSAAIEALREVLHHALLGPARRAEAERALAALTREVTARQELAIEDARREVRA